MRTSSPSLSRWLAAAALLTVLVAPVAGGAAPAKPHAQATARDTLRAASAVPHAAPIAATRNQPAESFDAPPVVRSRIGVNLTSDALDAPGNATVVIEFEVDSLGMVHAPRVAKGGTPYDSAAVDAARWWVFDAARHAGARVNATIRMPVDITVPANADPMTPDVLALALQAEASGDLQGALDAWSGVCARIGTHPLLADDYTPRVHAIRCYAALKPAPIVPPATAVQARGAHSMMLRDMSRGSNADFARTFDEVLRIAPWYGIAYRWRASARAASGQRDDAMRDVRLYALASPDSASQEMASRALRALAVGDTIAALTMLK